MIKPKNCVVCGEKFKVITMNDRESYSYDGELSDYQKLVWRTLRKFEVVVITKNG